MEPLKYHLKNLCLPRIVVDELRVALRNVFLDGSKTNNDENWNRRSALNFAGLFAFEMAVLHIATKTTTHHVRYRKDLHNGLQAKKQQQVKESLAEQRIEMLEDVYIDLADEAQYHQ